MFYATGRSDAFRLLRRSVRPPERCGRSDFQFRYHDERATESDLRVGQGIPSERQGRPQQGDLPQPLRPDAGGGHVYSEKCCGALAGRRRLRTLRGGQGAGVGALRPDAGRTRPDRDRFRPLLHGRERRRASLRGVARHQYGGLLRRGRFPFDLGAGRSRAHRHPRHLRLGRHGAQCRCRRYAHSGDRRLDDVRHEPRDGQRLFRRDGRRRTPRTPPAAPMRPSS